MADDITLNSGSGGDTLGADDIGGVKYQIVKAGLGALDSLTLLDGNSGNKSAGTLRVVLATDQPALTNKLLVTPDLPSGAATSAKQDTQITAEQAIQAALETAGGLVVNLGANNDVTVTGTVDLGATDNAVLDAIAASVAVMDDWDESDRAKVNLIVGQAGIAGGTGTDGATVPRVTLATNVPLPAGTNGIGKLTANSGVDIGDVDVTSISAGTNLIGDVGIQPRTTNGLDTFMASGSDGSSILVATAQVIKASAGKLYGYYAYNPEAAVSFVHFYNTAAASVTVGTTNPLFTLAIPAGSAANLMSEIGITFSNAGWSCAATTTAGGNTAPSTGVSLVAWYK